MLVTRPGGDDSHHVLLFTAFGGGSFHNVVLQRGGLSELKKVLRMAVLNKELLKEKSSYLLFVWPSGSGVSGFDVERISSIWCYCLHLVEVTVHHVLLFTAPGVDRFHNVLLFQ